MTFEPGQKIGDYEIVAKLGAGGLGVVYEVKHLISQRREAMKILLPDQTDTPEMVERFRREVQTLATLNHRNIASLHTAFYIDRQLAMVMELIHGDTLRELQTKAPPALPDTLNITSQVLQALVYAHNLGVVHRDIKPSNIMITSGMVKLLDFGIARVENSSDLTKAGFLVGSLNYMSPEQVRGQRASASSDIYSVGVTLYELLTGKLPITGATNYEIMMGHLHQTPVAPQDLTPLIAPALSAIVMKSLEKEPSSRFASAAEFLTALQSVAAGVQPPMELAPTAALPSAPNIRAVGTGPAHTSFGATSMPSAGTLGSFSGAQKPPSGSGIQGLPLEELSRKLAVYIGPVAKFVVKKIAAQTEDIDTIYREAAKQITSDTDRVAFLRSRRQ